MDAVAEEALTQLQDSRVRSPPQVEDDKVLNRDEQTHQDGAKHEKLHPNESRDTRDEAVGEHVNGYQREEQRRREVLSVDRLRVGPEDAKREIREQRRE